MRTLTNTSAVPMLLMHGFVFGGFAFGQTVETAAPKGPQPLYQVTIVSRTTKALNYGYLTTPTRIDFKGTPVLADARGEAVVEPRRGATMLNIKFEHVPPPTRFGPQFLTYVVWAISPDGRAQNLGELSLDASDKGKLRTSTPLQTFAMIVTAEPYFSVTQPSDVVVMENMIGPRTVGKIQEVNATYELLPRKPYTYDVAAQKQPTGQPVSMGQYEATMALHQALNAIQIAVSQNADKYAPEGMARAREVYNQARGYPSHLNKEVVSLAREAAQIAEDARAVAVKRAAADKAATEEQSQTQAAPPPPAAPAQGTASTQTQRSRVTETAANSRPDQLNLSRSTVASPEMPRSTASSQTASSETAIQVDNTQFLKQDPRAQEMRKAFLASLPRSYEVLDTTRGVVITLSDQAARATTLSTYLTPLANAVRGYRDLHVAVEGHSDDPNSTLGTEQDSAAVRRALISAGMPAEIITAQGYGNTKPRVSNASTGGRQQNRRVEIVIAGDPIGTLPSWDRTYRLDPSATGRR